MIKKYKSIMFLLSLTTLLTGCWDYNDVNKRSIILANGIDETDDKIEFTGEIASLLSKNSSSGGKGQITDTYINVATGRYFEDARSAYNSHEPFESFLGAQRAIVFSQKYAERGIESYINRNYNAPEFRSSALTAVSKESSREFFSGKIENDISIGYAAEDTIKYLSDTGAALYKIIQEINADIQFGDIGYLLPYITKKEGTIEYIGMAAMKDSKLVGIIDKKESDGFLFILSKKATNIIPFPHPSNEKNLVSIKSKLKKRRVRTSYENNKVNIYLDLKLISQIYYPYKIEMISKNDIKKLEEMVSRKVEHDVLKAIERSKNEFKCDVFAFGRYFKSQNMSTYRKINWKEEYLNAEFHINVTTKIKNTNLLDTKIK
ncbi:Ger(x)C family spore germination protein [Clostridium sp. YIM B02515]|uniref:Ger(X)C family spore germination protein n=1 Tax=Clostridium rhizosphaerae TaxID=2803861 RepID=A0ABS1TH12_9CLOT|nr:Ger(x)C family spore germination protein [Clostridium rhizosphaerae]MBL4938640.1 Ger(x)C family spore germination protein [Clostridium rhizosphaerae]